MSDFGLAIITASTFAASAVRNNAPTFPGFSGASATSIKGFFDVRCNASSVCDFVLPTAITPSVVPRCANF